MSSWNRLLSVPSSLLFLSAAPAIAARPVAPSAPAAHVSLCADRFASWSGAAVAPDGRSALLPAGGAAAVFRYPQGPKGWYIVGFRDENDGTRDWRDDYGLQVELQVPEGRTVTLHATIETPRPALRQEYLPRSRAWLTVHGAPHGGWQRVTLPWTAFDFDPSQSAFLKFVRSLRLSGEYADGRPGPPVRFRDVRLALAENLALRALVQGKAVAAGRAATYPVTVTNCTDNPQDVRLRFAPDVWATMAATVAPAQLRLAPGASANVMVTVRVPVVGVPPGGHETETLTADDGVGPPADLEFITARDVARPNILHTPEEWAAIRRTVQRYSWAKAQADAFIRAADAWQVPAPLLPPHNYSTTEKHAFAFTVPDYEAAHKTAIAYQLTGDRRYAEKVALFLRRVADPKTGYPATLAAMNQGGPQEGGNFQTVAMDYDAILGAGVLTGADRASIERTFRLYMETFEPWLTEGNIGNWSVAQSTACLYCALALGDLKAADRYLYGPCGFMDYLTKGVMDDGWWWECSTSYNMWVAAELTQTGLACRPWGIDLLHAEFPANFSPNTIVNPWAIDPPYGISFLKWGPNHRNTRSIRQLWDAVVRATDYRGVTFGLNDGHEERVGGQGLELAYYVYRDPAYATLIRQNGGGRDLLYGVPELPSDTPKLYHDSGYAENIGYALLRSQTAGRPVADQIQVVAKIGTQGGYHGHFDRVSLDNITRYGRSFWNPETIWYGYPNYMYKFFVQTSVNHNMVVVDGKQQEAVPSSQLLFHSGPMMQAVVQETNARWADPPYGGMQYFPGDTFASQMRKNRQTVPLATDRQYGAMGPWSDRVLQRRLTLVTDDYIVLADYLHAAKPHTFDDLFQMKALSGLEAPQKTLLRHDGQYDPDPRRAGQFITDCDWYRVSAPSVAHFTFPFGTDADNAGTMSYLNTPGTLNMDLYTLWPRQALIMTAMPPEQHNEQQWVTYRVTGDGRELAHGESGVWILGEQDVDVPIAGLKELTLSVTTDGMGKKNALFWANARLVTADGKEVPLAGVAPGENVAARPGAAQDYYGGPIKIAGVRYADALPTQPADRTRPAIIRIPLQGTNAVRFRATLGGDFPFGDERERRKVYAVREQGTEARFLTVLEPFADQRMVRSASADGPDTLRVELADGRVQEITVQNLDAPDKPISITITELRDGKVVRRETATSSDDTAPGPAEP